MTSLLHSMTLRWRLALLSGGLTFLVLCVFAVVIGQTTASRIRSDFRNEMSQAVDKLLSRKQLPVYYNDDGRATIPKSTLGTYAAANQAVIRVLLQQGGQVATTDGAPDFGKLGLRPDQSGQVGGYRVLTRRVTLGLNGSSAVGVSVYVQYARKTASTEASVHQVRLFLLFGVLLGTTLALGAVVFSHRFSVS